MRIVQMGRQLVPRITVLSDREAEVMLQVVARLPGDIQEYIRTIVQDVVDTAATTVQRIFRGFRSTVMHTSDILWNNGTHLVRGNATMTRALLRRARVRHHRLLSDQTASVVRLSSVAESMVRPPSAYGAYQRIN